MDGPPSSSASTDTAMKLGVTPVMRMWPPPSRPILAACKVMTIPTIIRAANTDHVRYDSP